MVARFNRMLVVLHVVSDSVLGMVAFGLAYAIRFQAVDRTLKDGEVAAARQSCIDAVIAAAPFEI